MSGIGKIKIAYKDPACWRSLAHLQARAVQNKSNEDLSRYILHRINMANLKRFNILVSFEGSETPRYLLKESDNARADEILFSAISEEISTHAGACSSYMLFCENAKIAAAVHVAAKHILEPSFHKKMLRYAYANLKRLAPTDNIKGYISGMELVAGPEYASLRKHLIVQMRPALMSSVKALMSLGVDIRSIDIGDHYCSQVLSPKTGKYSPIIKDF
jgi:hypothetical protein